MGFLFSKIVEFFSRTKNNFKILILGIQNAGKTTILYRLSIGQLVKTSPTIGSNVEEISYENVKFQAWDLGGQESMRSVWDMYYMNTDGVIYVIDSNDADNYEESKAQFYKVLQNEALKNAVILILANKQDIMTAKKVPELISIYDFENIKDHVWHIQGCSAETGEGLLSGIKWLSDQLVYKNTNTFPNNPYVANNELDQSDRNLNTANKSQIEKANTTETGNTLNQLNAEDPKNPGKTEEKKEEKTEEKKEDDKKVEINTDIKK